MVKLAKVTSFHFGSPYSCIICNVQIRMHSFPCVDETGCTCAGLYKGNLVFNKDLTLNVTLKKKKQLNLIPMQHLFLSLDLNEADSLPLPLYIHSSQKFTQLGSNPISLK